MARSEAVVGVNLGAASPLFGTLVGKSVTVSENSIIHQDLALQTSGQSSGRRQFRSDRKSEEDKGRRKPAPFLSTTDYTHYTDKEIFSRSCPSPLPEY